MNELMKPGDLIATRGWFGVNHVAIVAPVFGELLVYESTSTERPPCVRTGRQAPKGVQAHRLDDILKYERDDSQRVYHHPLIRPLYIDEIDRLLAVLESCLGMDYEFISDGELDGKAGDWLGKDSAALVVKAWASVGVIQHYGYPWRPQQLVRYAKNNGIIGPGRLIEA